MKANKTIADELLDKGGGFFDKGKWDHALECWERANGIYEELGDKQGITIIHGNIGNVYLNMGELGANARILREKSYNRRESWR